MKPVRTIGPSDPERDQEIESLYLRDLLSMSAIGLALGVSRQRVHQILKRRGIIGRSTGVAVDRAGICTAARAGMTATAIGDQFGCSPDKVRRLLKLEGIPLKGNFLYQDLGKLLAEYRRLARVLERVPSNGDIRKYSKISVKPFVQAFGGLRALQLAAGFVPLNVGRRPSARKTHVGPGA